MRFRTVWCPHCASKIERAQISFFDKFSCKHCGKELKIGSSYATRIYWISLVLPVLTASISGLRGLAWLAAVASGVFLTMFLLVAIFPPQPVSAESD
jgi:hypothetical protein